MTSALKTILLAGTAALAVALGAVAAHADWTTCSRSASRRPR